MRTLSSCPVSRLLCGALAFGIHSRSFNAFALGDAVLLIAIGGLRIFLAASFGPLRRRRAFEPERVRETPGALGWPYWLAVAGAVLVIASLLTGWLNFLDGQKHPAVSAGAVVVWVAVALVGFAVGTVAFVLSKDGALAVSATAGQWLGRATAVVFGVIARFLIAPATDIARRLGDWIPEGDGALGRVANTSGQLALAAARGPALPLVIVLAVVLALVFALVAPGVAR